MPSITTICDPFAVPFVFVIEIFPVEYIAGDPLPVVVIVESLIDIFEFDPVENTALLPLALVDIVAFLIVAVEFSVTKILIIVI